MKNTGKILIAFAAGAVAGAVSGILFAPGKGSDTRQKITDEGKKIADAVNNKLHRSKEKQKSLKEEPRNVINEDIDDFEEA